MPAPDVKRGTARLRIALPTGIFPPDIGGPASYVPRIAGALTDRGHGVEVITLADDPSAGGAYPFPIRRIRRGMSRLPRMIQTISAVARAARKADIIYANGLFIEAAIAAAVARKPLLMKIVGDWAWERARNRGEGAPTVEEFQSRRQSLRSEAVKWLRSLVTRRADRVLTPSAYLAAIVAAWGIPAARISLVYNAFEPLPAEPAALPGFPGRTLITVARLVPWKGVDGLLELLAANADWRLIVVGDGPERSNLEALAARRKVTDRALFTGGIPRAQVASYLKAADIFVLNSSYEGLPHIVLEAFAAGVPVAAASAGGTPEVIADGVSGLLVPPGRAELLGAAVRRILADQVLRENLITGGRRTLAERFQWETMVAATETVLAETALRRAGG
jgi:glycosyltransferase involved in cell wall biosynthesis